MTYHTSSISGPNAAVAKYDVISALTCVALTGGRSQQTIIMRLINLITCRYNWRKNELSIGSEEVAELTFTSQRTAKRTLKALTDQRFLIVRLQGRKGRVTKYGLGLSAIFQAAAPHAKPKYHQFSERIDAVPLGTSISDPAIDFTVEAQPCQGWTAICTDIADKSQPLYVNWFADMVGTVKNGELTVACKTNFIQNYARTKLLSNIYGSANAVGIKLTKVEFTTAN